MGVNGDCGCGGSCGGNGKTNGNGRAPAWPNNGPNGSNGRRSFMPGPFLVRKPAILNTLTSAGGVTGDGKGSENPVPVAGANQVVLLLDTDDNGQSNSLEFWMETSINGTDYYRETAISVTGGAATVTKKTYSLSGTLVSANDRVAVALDVLSAFARFTFGLSAANQWTNVACRAITGRV